MVVKKNKMNESFESDFSKLVGHTINTETIEDCLDIISKAFRNYEDIEEFNYDPSKNFLYFLASKRLANTHYWINMEYDNELTFTLTSTTTFGLPYTQDIISELYNSIYLNITPEALNNTFNRLRKALNNANVEGFIELFDFMYYDY